MPDYTQLNVQPIATVNQLSIRAFARGMPLLHKDIEPQRIEETIVTLFKMATNGCLEHQHTTIEMFSLAIALSTTIPSIPSQEVAKRIVVENIESRGDDYGNTVLDVMGTWYTATNAAAKALRLWDYFVRNQDLLMDELLDIAGYCVLSMAILDSMKGY